MAGVLAMIMAAGLFIHAGMLIEKRKSVSLTKTDLMIAAALESAGGVYFMVAGIGAFAT